MLCLFLTVLSCSALRLLDPVSLRDVTEENVSLHSWCVGVGCVMPFTPATCLSWCDWNFDKQADAEARGAFAGSHWGDKHQVLATAFSMVFATVTGTDCNTKYNHYFMDPKKPLNKGLTYKTSGKHVPIYPGGDEEKKMGDTVLKCDTCYLVQADAASTTGPVAAQFSVEFIAAGKGAGTASLMKIYTQDNTKKCKTGTVLFTHSLPVFTAGVKNKKTQNGWDSAGGACKVYAMADPVKIAICDALILAVAASEGVEAVEDQPVCHPQNGMAAANGDKVTAGEDAAGLAARKACCKAGVSGHTNLGFGLNGNLAWPTCDA